MTTTVGETTGRLGGDVASRHSTLPATGSPRARVRRRHGLHAGAWWLWALGLAAAATRTLNPLVLFAVIGVAALVVSARRTRAPWAGSFRAFVLLGMGVVVLRVVLETLFGPATPGTVVVTLPEVMLPSWLAGARLGGVVTVPALAAAFAAGLQLAAVLVALGAATALAAPTRLIKSVPGALYEVGVALVVALTVVPQTVVHAGRVREARRLRGRPERGWRAWAGTAGPVLNAALERSLLLAAAMDSRGFGRRRELPVRTRRIAAASMLGGLIGVLAGLYGLLATAGGGRLGTSLLVGGAVLLVLGVQQSGRRSLRSVYRPDPWGWPEWACAASGLAAATAVAVSSLRWPAELAPLPGTWPPLPVVALVGVLVAALPAVVAPLPEPSSPRSASAEVER